MMNNLNVRRIKGFLLDLRWYGLVVPMRDSMSLVFVRKSMHAMFYS